MPELRLSLPPAAPDVLAELGGLAGEVPSAASPSEVSVRCAGTLYPRRVPSAEWGGEVMGGDCRSLGEGARVGVFLLPVPSWTMESLRVVGCPVGVLPAEPRSW